MEQKFGRVPAVVLTALFALSAYFLRFNQLATAYDAQGQVLPGAGNCFFTYLTVGLVLAFGVYAFFLRSWKAEASLEQPAPVLTVVGMGAALTVGLGSFAMFRNPLKSGDSLTAILGFIATLSWLTVCIQERRGQKAGWIFYLLPVVFFGLKLLADFRVWGRDPKILDYCYDLFALLATLCAVLHSSGFRFGKGKRRLTVFFCLTGIFFQAAALAGAPKREIAISLGAILWMGTQLWRLLGKPGEKSE